jgi:tRNA threonylcarbamoyl adenosine modification protein YeaZ
MLLVLALDTTTRPGSLALERDDQVLAVASGDPGRTHAERLPGDITSLLSGARVDLKQIDVFAVAAGPGSFTGLRIGIATIQGLAFALDRPVVAVSTLDALARIAAESTSQSPALVAAWMDAQRSEVFAALYQVCARPGGSQSLDAGAAFDLIDGPVSAPDGGRPHHPRCRRRGRALPRSAGTASRLPLPAGRAAAGAGPGHRAPGRPRGVVRPRGGATRRPAHLRSSS